VWVWLGCVGMGLGDDMFAKGVGEGVGEDLGEGVGDGRVRV